MASNARSPRARSVCSSNVDSASARKSWRLNLSARSRCSSAPRYSPQASHQSTGSGSARQSKQVNISRSAMGAGWAQERHFAVVIFGNEAQQEAQQEDVRSRHGSSDSQAAHQDGRTIRSASRPTIDNAPRSLLWMLDTAGFIAAAL